MRHGALTAGLLAAGLVLAGCGSAPTTTGAGGPAPEGADPYADYAALTAQAEVSAAELSDDDLSAALDGHPRIGERAGAGHDAEFSTREQAQVDRDDAEVMAALADGNREYERRFDRVFLIRAACRSSSEILAELRRRLGNADDTERAETVAALREIALLRLKDVM